MAQADNPGVIVLPPVLYGIAFAVVFALHWSWPLPVLSYPASLWAGIAALSLGAALAAWGFLSLKKAGTNILPTQPTTALVASGPFRLSRNPIYIAISLVFLGLSFMVNSLWGVIALVPLSVVMHYGVILREERYLEKKFGENYRRYRSTVRRYL